jgi:hypothetical protein
VDHGMYHWITSFDVLMHPIVISSHLSYLTCVDDTLVQCTLTSLSRSLQFGIHVVKISNFEHQIS